MSAVRTPQSTSRSLDEQQWLLSTTPGEIGHGNDGSDGAAVLRDNR
jgi:hypothetical protein